MDWYGEATQAKRRVELFAITCTRLTDGEQVPRRRDALSGLFGRSRDAAAVN